MIDHKGFNHMHLNGFVDVLSKVMIDAVIQPGQSPDERAALHSMLSHFSPDNPEQYIITADRGYECYDLMFHCFLKLLNFVFRAKAPSSPTSLLSAYASELPDSEEEFDITISRYLTDRSTKIMKDTPDVYHYMNPNKNIPHFKPLLDGHHLFYFKIRVVKIKAAPDKYEYMITNLPSSFTIDDIKTIYHYRWNAEITFRYLKYAVGMLWFHSKKPEFLKQEIYASLIRYNFGVLIANEAISENDKKTKNPDNKHQYEIDFSTALKISIHFLRQISTVHPPDIIKLMLKYVHAVKTKFRQFDRPLRGIGAIHFSYR
jgi:hypothetical protein